MMHQAPALRRSFRADSDPQERAGGRGNREEQDSFDRPRANTRPKLKPAVQVPNDHPIRVVAGQAT